MINVLMTPSKKNLKKSLHSRKLVFFYKIVKGLASSYLLSYLLPDNKKTHNARSSLRKRIKSFATRTLTFRVTCFPYCRKEWN